MTRLTVKDVKKALRRCFSRPVERDREAHERGRREWLRAAREAKERERRRR